MYRLAGAAITLIALSASGFSQSVFVPNAQIGTSTNGNVGIGTSSPDSALTVAGDLHLQRSGGSAYYIQTPSTDTRVFTWGAYPLLIGANGHTDQLVLSPSGFVGIGTNSVGSPLHVYGAGNANLGTIRLDSGSPFTSITSRQSDFVAEPEGFAALQTSYTTGNNWVSIGGGLDEFNAATALYFYTAPNISTRAGTPRMVIDSSGRVGIGTTSPLSPLQVVGLGNAGLGTIRLDSANIFTSITTRQYDTTNEPEGFSSLSNSSDATRNWVHVGGGMNEFNAATSLFFYTAPDVSTRTGSVRMMIDASGNVGIGTSNPTQKLSVNGTIRAKEVVVETTGWSDYVFDQGYRLAPLSEVERQIKTEKHLPGIPSSTDVAEHGVGLGEIQAKLLAKVEELTLHAIAQEKLLRSQAGLLEKQSELLRMQQGRLKSLEEKLETVR